MMKKNTYNIITIGCQMNKSDSERIAGYLEQHNFSNAGRKKSALVILNTCGVRQSAEDRTYGLVRQIKKDNPKAKIILAGCLSQRTDVQKKLKDRVDIWLPIIKLPQLADLLGLNQICPQASDYLDLKPKYGSDFRAFVPIGNGCNNFCSYCVVPFARGREVYRSSGKILAEVKNLVKKGYKEINLIAQNVNSYKFKERNRVVDFPALLKAVDEIEGDFWIRFATSHPKDMSDKLIKVVAAGKKICEHIHLPAQSGDNKILAAMNRGYTVEHYENLIAKIKKAIPQVALTTDIIVGFPSESKKQFQNTLELFKRIKFDLAYIARYSPRPGTAAFVLDDNVGAAEKKRREEKLRQVLRQTALANNQRYLGRVVDILVEGEGRDGLVRGKTRTYKNVKIKGKEAGKKLAGRFVKVKIIKAQDFGLIGEVV